jgi:toxin ParE1/3/4
LADLREIGDFIAQDDPARALAFVRALRARCADAAARPLAFPARGDIAPGVRQAPLHGRHRILFRALPDRLRVLRVVHGARDLGRVDVEA